MDEQEGFCACTCLLSVSMLFIMSGISKARQRVGQDCVIAFAIEVAFAFAEALLESGAREEVGMTAATAGCG